MNKKSKLDNIRNFFNINQKKREISDRDFSFPINSN